VLHDPAKKRASRRKGATEERALVRYLQDRGFAAEKTSRTGYRGSDISMPLLGVDRSCEVKCRARGFRQLYDWLGGNDFLIVRSDRKPALVVIPLWLASEIAAVAEGHKTVVINEVRK
jgi:Holliday junction resolvase